MFDDLRLRFNSDSMAEIIKLKESLDYCSLVLRRMERKLTAIKKDVG